MTSTYSVPTARSNFIRHALLIIPNYCVSPEEIAFCLQPVYDRLKLMDLLNKLKDGCDAADGR